MGPVWCVAMQVVVQVQIVFAVEVVIKMLTSRTRCNTVQRGVKHLILERPDLIELESDHVNFGIEHSFGSAN